jgi:hypothetical protein
MGIYMYQIAIITADLLVVSVLTWKTMVGQAMIAKIRTGSHGEHLSSTGVSDAQIWVPGDSDYHQPHHPYLRHAETSEATTQPPTPAAVTRTIAPTSAHHQAASRRYVAFLIAA